MRVWSTKERINILKLVPKDDLKRLPANYITSIFTYINSPNYNPLIAELLNLEYSKLNGQRRHIPGVSGAEAYKKMVNQYWKTRRILETLGFNREDGPFMYTNDYEESCRNLREANGLSEGQARSVHELLLRSR